MVCFVTGLEKHSSARLRVRRSSPKLLPWTNALVTEVDTRDFSTALADGLPTTSHQLLWWRKSDDEVDFVVTANDRLWAIEKKNVVLVPLAVSMFFAASPAKAARGYLRRTSGSSGPVLRTAVLQPLRLVPWCDTVAHLNF